VKIVGAGTNYGVKYTIKMTDGRPVAFQKPQTRTTKTTEFTGLPGEYLVTALYTEIYQGSPIILELTTKVVITPYGGGPTPPPGPNPPPGPQPPPAPIPTTLTGQMQAAYTAETNANKAAYKASWAIFFRAASAVAKESTLVTTYGDLKKYMDSQLLNPDGTPKEWAGSKLPKMAAVWNAYLNSKLPTGETGSTTPINRETAPATYNEIAAAIEAAR
jgi:hypothetical protein